MNKLRLYTILSLLFCSCSDTSEDLSGGFFYRDEGGDIKEILNHNAGNMEIYGKVVDYAWNDSIILVKQEPSIADHKAFIAFYLRDDTVKYSTDSAGIAKSMHDADSILHNDLRYRKIFARKVNYWIILHNRAVVPGPLSYTEYLSQRQALHIPQTLNLQE